MNFSKWVPWLAVLWLLSLPASGANVETIVSGGVGITVTTSADGRTVTISPKAPITEGNASHNLIPDDCGRLINFTNGASISVTAPNTLPAGCTVALYQGNTGQITVLGDGTSGRATLHSKPGYTKTSGRYAVIDVSIVTNAGGSAADGVIVGDGA